MSGECQCTHEVHFIGVAGDASISRDSDDA